MATEPFQLTIDIPDHNGQRCALLNIQAASAVELRDRLRDARAEFFVLDRLTEHWFKADGQTIAVRAPSPPPVTPTAPADGAKCPDHGKSKRGNYGLYCPAKVDADNFCSWRMNDATRAS